MFAYLIGASRPFLIIAPYTLTYLLTDEFLVDKYLCQFYAITRAN